MAAIEKRTSPDGAISWRARVRKSGCKPLSKTFARKGDADAWARQVEARLDRGFALPTREYAQRTLADGIERWISDRLPEMATSDQKNVRHMLDWWRSELGDVALMRIEPTDIEEGARKLRNEKDSAGQRVRSDARVNRYLAALSRVFGFCERTLRWVEANPCRSVRRFRESPGRTRFLSEDETALLLKAVDSAGRSDFSLFVRTALGTGARRGEVARLQWRDVDLTHARVTFRGTKNGDDRTVPLPATIVELIKAHGKVRPIDPNASLFPHDFRHHWRQVQGLLPDFRFHDTRHTVASHLAMNGASLLDIAAVTGHKTLIMVKRYSHLTDAHVRGKMEEVAEKLLK